MVKSTIKHFKEKVDIKFPKLMICEYDAWTIVVLFSSLEVGTVVYTTCKDRQIGEHDKSWYMPGFKDFDGTIVLSND